MLRIHLFHQNLLHIVCFDAELIRNMLPLQSLLTILWNTAQILQNCINCQKTECFMIFTCQSCILRCIGIFISLEYGKTGAVEKNCSCYCNILRQYSNWLWIAKNFVSLCWILYFIRRQIVYFLPLLPLLPLLIWERCFVMEDTVLY